MQHAPWSRLISPAVSTALKDGECTDGFTPPRSALFSTHCLDDFHGLDADARHALHEIDHFLLVIREAVGVELFADGRVLRRPFLVLVENPFERRPVASCAGSSTPQRIACLS